MAHTTNKKRWIIISGGQTGVDRAALVSAMSFAVSFGGWVPKGRLAEDGVIPEGFYALKELPEGGYRERTRANVRDSDATLILVDKLPLTGGTALTAETAQKLSRPYKVVNIAEPGAQRRVYDWMMSLEELPGIGEAVRLNVAGPRESVAPGIFEKTKSLFNKLLWEFRNYSGGDIIQIDDDGEIGGWISDELVGEIFDVKKNIEAARG